MSPSSSHTTRHKFKDRSGPSKKALICVFAKPPVPGKVKTRLGAEIGDAYAAALARAFLKDTWALVSSLKWARAILATTEDTANAFGLSGEVNLWLQGDGDLGRRLEHIIQRGLAEADCVIAVGADSPGLPERLLVEAHERLAKTDAVLGPSDDGGFYLIALKRCPSGLFSDLPWSTSTTFAATRERLKERGMSVCVLDAWFDVDRTEDLERLRSMIGRGELQANETARVLTSFPQGVAPCAPTSPVPRVSVIVPVLNEEAQMGGLLDALDSVPGIHEVIVVDGASTDCTAELVRGRGGTKLLSTGRGRARQMNAGAEIATGDVLVFLHADVRLPPDAARWIATALADPGVVAGAFRTWTVAEERRLWLGPLLHLADLRSRYTSLPYGDQALFVRAAVFKQLGGFPDQPLMEDLELSLRLRRVGRIRTVPASVRVSGRRFLARPVYYTFLVNVFPLLYRLGMPPRVLANLYGNPR